MAEYQRPQDQPHHQFRLTGAFKGEQGPSKSQVVAVATLLPVGGLLLLLAGITLIGTLIGLAVTTPLFVICSPVLVPAALTMALAVAGFLTSGAFGITALSSFSWILNNLRRTSVPEHLEQAKRRAQEGPGHVGQKAREMGQKTQETTRT